MLGLERLLAEDEPHLADGTDAQRAPGRRAVGHADRAARRGPERQAATARTGTATAGRRRGAALRRGGARGRRGDRRGRGAASTGTRPPRQEEDDEEEQLAEQPEDPGAARRFWFEHATGAGKTVAALGFVEASRTGGILILTHRRNLVDQFIGELHDRGYKKRISRAAARRHGKEPRRRPGHGRDLPVVRPQRRQHLGRVHDRHLRRGAHRARREDERVDPRWQGPIFIGMTATGALIARHVTDLFPTQTSRFDLAQAARRGVIAPLRCVRIPPGRRRPHDRQGAAAQGRGGPGLRPGRAGRAARPGPVQRGRRRPLPRALQGPAGRRLLRRRASTRTTSRRRSRTPGMKAKAVSGETPKRELTRILAAYERGEIDVLVNAQLLAEGWNSPRATVCMHLAPTASKRIYQQRVGRVTRRNPGKEAGIVVDFVHPATTHDDPVVTLHSLLDRDVYRGGAIVVGPVRRGRGRRLRVERRVLPVSDDPERRAARLRARALADRGREPALGRAARLGRARRRARRVEQLAPREGDAPLRLDRRAAARASSSPACSATATRSCASARSRRSLPRATRRRSTRPSRSSAAGRATSAARA